jgi:RNA 2',3'-cyclic 3'-phosphodiesterase
MRCFAAILLDDAVRAAVAEEVERLRPLSRAVAWVPAENLHLTLHFLGEQSPDRAEEASAALSEAAASAVPFTLSLHGLGAFPGLDRARILWTGVADGALEARALQARVEDALERRGFVREARPWHPHVTLGRVFDERRWRRDSGTGFRSAVAAAATRSFGGFAVTSLALMQSELGRSGARYRVVAESPLGG